MKGIVLTTIMLAAAGPACAGSAFEQLLHESGGKEVSAVTVPASAQPVPLSPFDIYSSESYRTILPDCYPGHRYGLDANGACIKETRRSQFFKPSNCAKSQIEVVDAGYCRFERIARQVKAVAGRCRFKDTRNVDHTMSYGLGFCEALGTCEAQATVVGDSWGKRSMRYEIDIVDEDCRCYKVEAKSRRTIFTNPFNGPIWADETTVKTLDSEACAALMETDAYKEAVRNAYQEAKR